MILALPVGCYIFYVSTFVKGILVAVAVGVALGIFIGGVLLAVVGSRINRLEIRIIID